MFKKQVKGLICILLCLSILNIVGCTDKRGTNNEENEVGVSGVIGTEKIEVKDVINYVEDSYLYDEMLQRDSSKSIIEGSYISNDIRYQKYISYISKDNIGVMIQEIESDSNFSTLYDKVGCIVWCYFKEEIAVYLSNNDIEVIRGINCIQDNNVLGISMAELCVSNNDIEVISNILLNAGIELTGEGFKREVKDEVGYWANYLTSKYLRGILNDLLYREWLLQNKNKYSLEDILIVAYDMPERLKDINYITLDFNNKNILEIINVDIESMNTDSMLEGCNERDIEYLLRGMLCGVCITNELEYRDYRDSLYEWRSLTYAEEDNYNNINVLSYILDRANISQLVGIDEDSILAIKRYSDVIYREMLSRGIKGKYDEYVRDIILNDLNK